MSSPKELAAAYKDEPCTDMSDGDECPGCRGCALSALARAVLASPAVESAPVASGWRREPPTAEEVRAGRFWWWRHAGVSGGEVLALSEFNGMVNYDTGLSYEGVDELPPGEWSPCLPPSAPAADAGIVARPSGYSLCCAAVAEDPFFPCTLPAGHTGDHKMRLKAVPSRPRERVPNRLGDDRDCLTAVAALTAIVELDTIKCPVGAPCEAPVERALTALLSLIPEEERSRDDWSAVGHLKRLDAEHAARRGGAR